MKPFKRTLKWGGIIVGGLAVIVLIGNTWFVWTTGARLERQLAEIRQTGAPMSLADLTRPPISPEQNASTYLLRAEDGMRSIAKLMLRYQVWTHLNDIVLGQSEPLMSPEIQRVVQRALDANPDVIPLLEQAAACPDYDAQLNYDMPHERFLVTQWVPTMQRLRVPARILDARALLLTSSGQRDESVRTALVIFRLARHADRNPMMASYLVASMMRGIALSSVNTTLHAGPVSDTVRDALDAELALHESMEGYHWAIQCERASMLNCFPDPLADPSTRNFWLVSRPFWNKQESECLDVMRAYLDLARAPSPYRETERTLRTIYDQCAANTGGLGATWLPASAATHATVSRVRAYVRCLRVLNALQRHVSEGNAELPKLSELDLPPDTTTDPYTGEPLRIEKTSRGWLIYAVGRNFHDDGGEVGLSGEADVGISPPRLADHSPGNRAALRNP